MGGPEPVGLGRDARRRIGDADLDLVVENADFKRVGFDLGIRCVEPGSGADIEPPAVPRAGNGVTFQSPRPERSSHVRASIADRVIGFPGAEHRHHPPIHSVRPPLAIGNLADIGHGSELGQCTAPRGRVVKRVFVRGLLGNGASTAMVEREMC